MERVDVAIVGGGLIGPALGCALADVGFRVAIIDAQSVDRRRAPDFDGRAYAVTLATRNLLRQIGIWQTVEDKAQPIKDIHVSEGGARSPLLHFDPRELDEGRFGWILEDRFLRGALLDRMAGAGALHLIAEVTHAEFAGDGAKLDLSDGREMTASLVVAADGRRSGLAAKAGIRRIGWSYAQTGLVNAIEHEIPHQGLAHQSFFPGGPFAVLPLTGNRCSLVWSERRRTAEALSKLGDVAFTAELARRIDGRLGEIRLIGKRWAYPLDLTLALSYTAPRLALAGDAAHGIHPIAGQGMNLGMRDVAALAEVLTDAARLGLDIGAADVLSRYQRWRRFDATMMALGTDALNRLFSNDNLPLSALRQAGLRAVGGLNSLRRGFMREAIGAAGDPPKLLRDQPL